MSLIETQVSDTVPLGLLFKVRNMIQSVTYFSSINYIKSIHEMNSYYNEDFWRKCGFDVVYYVKVSYDFPK